MKNFWLPGKIANYGSLVKEQNNPLKSIQLLQSSGRYISLQLRESASILFTSLVLDLHTSTIIRLESGLIENTFPYSNVPNFDTLFAPLETKTMSLTFGNRPASFHFVGKKTPPCSAFTNSSRILCRYSSKYLPSENIDSELTKSTSFMTVWA